MLQFGSDKYNFISGLFKNRPETCKYQRIPIYHIISIFYFIVITIILKILINYYYY